MNFQKQPAAAGSNDSILAGRAPLRAIGLMSGTSIDGSVSAALIRTDGELVVERVAFVDFEYEPPSGERPIHHLTKAAEIAVRRANGDLTLAARLYPEAVREYVEKAFGFTGEEAKEKIARLTLLFRTGDTVTAPDRGKQSTTPLSLEEIIRRSTDVHGDAIDALLAAAGDAAAEEIQLIGYHGQTLFHAPFAAITVQVGEPQRLANRFKIPVVCDFRSNDIKHGGQGAPLAPVYHRALAWGSSREIFPGLAKSDSIALLNIGGSANVTVVGDSEEELIAFDTGPGNGLIDRFVSLRARKAYDQDSGFAAKGTVNDGALAELLEHSIVLADGRNYLDIAPPKSIDIRDYTFDLPAFLALSVEDGCATLNAFTAECVARGVEWVTKLGLDPPAYWVLSGGGAKSPHLRAQLTARLSRAIGRHATVRTADEVGWSTSGMEAELFGYLAVRSVRGMPLTFPTTTGVPVATVGGRTVRPEPHPHAG